MSERVVIEHEGRTYDPFHPDSNWTERVGVDDDVLEFRDRASREGRIKLANGREAPPGVASMVRLRLLTGATGGLPRARPRTAPRWLIPGLWQHGTHPMLSGNAKAGKSTAVADLIGALTTPRRQFLGHFAPVDRQVDPRHGNDLYVVVLNAEIEPSAYEAGLSAMGIDLKSPWLEVIHLDEHAGGPGVLDVTDPDKFDLWLSWLMECDDGCNEGDYWSPSVVIVDGLTAVLAAVGKSTDHYGLWFAAWKRLMKATEIPSSLIVAHSPITGGHPMGGTESAAGPDGLWSYDSANPDSGAAARFFSVVSRFGGVAFPKTRVRMGEDGLPRLDRQAAAQREQVTREEGREEEQHGRAEPMRAMLREAGREGVLTTTLTGDGPEGVANRKVLSAMKESGEVIAKAVQLKGRARGIRWWLAEVAPID
ncbi:AAA family ATPase [Agromyces silvae]|uniref:AAA family ATPase n=1 Tax=Agromyces silvae TaxID=3388266 RepID=UPI00280C1F33|nr:AAA family ATPase [Agromyces protaetiae]